MTESKLKNFLCEKEKEHSLFVYESLESTNKTAKILANQNQKSKTVVVSKSQTQGRGQKENNFFSPTGGFYFSIILRPKYDLKDLKFLSARAGIAAKFAIKSAFSKNVELKWINDIFYKNKKAGGILVENKINENNNLEYSVVGIGINLKNQPNLPQEIEKIFGFLDEENGFETLTYYLILETEKLENPIDSEKFVKEYNKDLYLKNEIVKISHNGKIFSGKLLGIDENLNLKVLENEKIKKYSYDDSKIIIPK